MRGHLPSEVPAGTPGVWAPARPRGCARAALVPSVEAGHAAAQKQVCPGRAPGSCSSVRALLVAPMWEFRFEWMIQPSLVSLRDVYFLSSRLLGLRSRFRER